MEELMDVKDLAKALKRPESWVYDNYVKLRIPHHRVGGGLRFRPSRVSQWLDEQ